MADFESRIQLPTEELGWCVVYDDHKTKEFEYEEGFERRWADVLPHLDRIHEAWWVDRHHNPILGLLIPDGIFVVMNMFFRTEFAGVPKTLYLNKERTKEVLTGKETEEYMIGFDAEYQGKKYKQVLEALADHTFKIMNSW